MHHQSKERNMSKSQKKNKKNWTWAFLFGLARFRFNEVRINEVPLYYTCYIERKLHIPYNPASARFTIGLLMFNALIQLKIIQY